MPKIVTQIRGMTPKQKLFTEKFAKHGNATRAVMEVYDTKSKRNASIMATNLKTRPAVKAEIDRLLKKHDLTDDLVFQRLKEGLDANVVSDYKGEVFATDIPDLGLRHKYMQDVLKIMAAYAPERKETANLNIDLQLEKLPPLEMAKLLKGLLRKVNEKDDNNTNTESIGDDN